ncbi:MAG: FKBP-type peptidyl-prolyl cis-trans isomerase [Planctomycetaceae bacterium]|nr:FKBP-type peptidyl-prolyl cis-trans isomerase [Planctomycetaceae bacterium]
MTESTTKTIDFGDCVQIHYTSKSLEGSIIETSARRDPFEFIVGADDVVPGLSKGLIGLSQGDKHSLAIPADQAFGKHNPDLIQSVSRLFVRQNVQAGDQLIAEVEGAPLDVWVQKVFEDEVQLDANHPLAGETLLIDIEIVHVESAEAAQTG